MIRNDSDDLINTEIYRIGIDTESEFFGNGIFSKICRIKGKKTNIVYLKSIIVYYTRDSEVKAIQLIFFNHNTKEIIHTTPKVFGSFESNNNKIIDEITLDLERTEHIYQIKGKAIEGRIVHFEIHTSKGQFIKVGGENEDDSNCSVVSKETKKKLDKKNLKTAKFLFEFLSNGRLFEGLNVGWNKSHVNFIDFMYKNEDIEEIENFLLNEEKKSELTDYSNFEIGALFDELPIINKSIIYGRFNNNTYYEDDYIKVQQIPKNLEDYYISNISIWYEKFLNCIEIDYTSKKNSEDKFRFTHTGTESNYFYSSK